MSLESQLHAKADKLLEKEYPRVLNEFTRAFRELTGYDLSGNWGGAKTESEELNRFVQAWRELMSFEGHPTGRAIYRAVRDMHREKFVRQFLSKVEELQGFVDGGEANDQGETA